MLRILHIRKEEEGHWELDIDHKEKKEDVEKSRYEKKGKRVLTSTCKEKKKGADTHNRHHTTSDVSQCLIIYHCWYYLPWLGWACLKFRPQSGLEECSYLGSMSQRVWATDLGSLPYQEAAPSVGKGRKAPYRWYTTSYWGTSEAVWCACVRLFFLFSVCIQFNILFSLCRIFNGLFV